MKLKSTFLALAISMSLLAFSNADDSLTTGTLEQGTRAKLKNPVEPQYPKEEQQRGIEGWVLLSFVVQPDGTVADPIIEDSSGSRGFEKAALKVIDKWTYEPATWNGVPVEQCHTNMRLTFAFTDAGSGGTRKFKRRYDRIVRLIDESKIEEANELLEKTASDYRLNLYEMARIWFLRSRVSAANGDKLGELKGLRRAAGEKKYMEPEVHASILRSIFWLEIESKKYSDAMLTYERLKMLEDELAPDISDIADQITSFVSGTQALGIAGMIPTDSESEEPPHWAYSLLRREFGFSELAGALGRLEVRCDWNRAIDVVSTEKIWTIPESWGQCRVFVFGESGASFKFIEYPSIPDAEKLSERG